MADKSKDSYEGHGDASPLPPVQKGTMISTGATAIPLSDKPIGVNQKTGNVQSGEKHGY